MAVAELTTKARPQRKGDSAMTEIKVYTITGCNNCEKVKEYLKAADLEFTECNIWESEAAAEELRKLSGTLNVPCVVAGNMIIRGFDKAELDSLIACLTATAGV